MKPYYKHYNLYQIMQKNASDFFFFFQNPHPPPPSPAFKQTGNYFNDKIFYKVPISPGTKKNRGMTQESGM